jgi:hypothetical protein
MARFIVVIDKSGQIVGAVRADPIETESGTIQAQIPTSAPLKARGSANEFRYREVEVSDDLVADSRLPVDDFHRHLERIIASGGQDPYREGSGTDRSAP